MNWQNIIKELLSSGLTQAEIAASIGYRQSYISDVLRGRRGISPGWDFGTKLLALHRARVNLAAE